MQIHHHTLNIYPPTSNHPPLIIRIAVPEGNLLDRLQVVPHLEAGDALKGQFVLVLVLEGIRPILTRVDTDGVVQEHKHKVELTCNGDDWLVHT